MYWLTKMDSVDGWNDVTPGSKWQEKASLCWRRHSQGRIAGFPSSSLISMHWKQHRSGERYGNFPTHGPTEAMLQFFSVWITWAGGVCSICSYHREKLCLRHPLGRTLTASWPAVLEQATSPRGWGCQAKVLQELEEISSVLRGSQLRWRELGDD